MEQPLTGQPPLKDEERLALYLEAESKYFVVPILTPLDRTTAIRFVIEQVTLKQTVEKMRKLSRLAIFYNLKETAPVFGNLLQRNEQQLSDYQRSALAIIALAWIGDDKQRQAAQSYFHSLQDRANVQQLRDIMLEATDALGPAEGTGNHRRWVEAEVTRLNALAQQYQEQSKHNEEQGIQIQIDELEDHLHTKVVVVEKSNTVRQALLALPAETQLPRLATLYIGDTADATPELSFWSAMMLLRLAEQGGSMRENIAREFLHLAQQYERKDPQWQAHIDLLRARCLRAVEYFAPPLVGPNHTWLLNQEDHGTDLLALRPHWKYPAGHTHHKD